MTKQVMALICVNTTLSLPLVKAGYGRCMAVVEALLRAGAMLVLSTDV